MRYLPGLERLRHYDRADLRGDAIAGLTVTAYLIPQVMAYSTLAGLPPQSGLWVIVVGFVLYALIGSSRLLSVGPESSTALLTATALAPLAGGDPVRYAALAALLALMVGALALIAALLRLGFIGDLLSKPILVGYMAGVGVLMISSQVAALTDTQGRATTFVQEFLDVVDSLASSPVPWAPLVMALTVAGLLIALRHRRFPWPLVVVVAAAAFTALVPWASDVFETVGAIPSQAPRPSLPNFTADDLALLALPALGILVVGYTDNLLTGRMLALGTGHRVHKNQEFVALGATNIGASLVSGFPVSSSASRSVLARSAGARTQMYSLVAAVLVVAMLLGAGVLLESFPLAALSGLIIFAAVGLIDLSAFARLWRFRRREFAVALLTAVGVLVFGLLAGIAIAVAVSVIELLTRVARPHAAELGTVPGLPGWHSIVDYPEASREPGLTIFRYDSPLFFANSEDFLRRAVGVLDSHPEARWFLVNVEAMSEVDITGLDALAELQGTCQVRGVRFGLVRAKSELVQALRRHGLLARIGDEFIFPTTATALEAFHGSAAG